MNIFENAYFGKAYKTKDGRKAIYLGESHHYELAVCDSDDYYDVYCQYNKDGSIDANGMEYLDIISEWHEPINQEELNILARKAVPPRYEYTNDVDVDESKREAWKEGYRKAMGNEE